MKNLIGFFILITLFSCKKTERSNVTEKPTHTITINRFDQTFYKTGSSPDSLFLDLYANQIMKVGEPGTQLFNQFDSIFRTDSQMRQIFKDCQAKFKNVSPIEDKLTLAFQRLNSYFPDIPYPKVYMHISGFGESIVSAPGILSASIDKYLGSDYELYKTLFNPYQTQRMYPEKIVADYMNGWVRSEFTEESMVKQQRLLDYMVYEGKLLYFMTVLLPDESMENISSFNKIQLDWCEKNEKNMWEAIMKLQHLYSTDPLVISKYLSESPRTTFFPEKSPGRAVIWTGFRIVEKFMNKKQNVSFQDLFNKDAQDILSESLYHP